MELASENSKPKTFKRGTNRKITLTRITTNMYIQLDLTNDNIFWILDTISILALQPFQCQHPMLLIFPLFAGIPCQDDKHAKLGLYPLQLILQERG